MRAVMVLVAVVGLTLLGVYAVGAQGTAGGWDPYPSPEAPVGYTASLHSGTIKLYVWNGASEALAARKVPVTIRISGVAYQATGYVESLEDGILTLRVLKARETSDR